MFKRLLLLTTLGMMLSGCFMAPIAFIGPAASGFSTASLIQSGITSTASYMVKKSTGKTIGQHALEALNQDTLLQSYFPEESNASLTVAPYK